MTRSGLIGCRPLKVVVGTVWLVVAAAIAQAQVSPPTFAKTFSPNVIGPGSVATLRFNMSNPSGTPATDLAFTDTLPAGVVIATPANELTDCGGLVTAPAGGGTVTFSGGSIGGGAACFVVVNVTSSAVGTHSNVTGDLTSSAGNSGTAAADLTVAVDRPGFSKVFAPNSVALGGRSTLTFTIDNTLNSNLVSSLTFADTLPSGMLVAGPADATTTCTGGSVTAVPGTQVVSLEDGSVLANSMCQVAVDVVAGGVGTLINTSGELTSLSGFSIVSSGSATAALDVTATPIALIKSFTNDPVARGGTVDLEFTIANYNRSEAATAITFTDDLDATLSGLVATGMPQANVCGAGSQISGTSLLTLTGGNLAAEGQCTFTVTLQVPVGAATGAYPNVTSALAADVGGSGVAGSPGGDILFVAPAPLLTKEFTDDPALPGGTVNLRFTIENISLVEDATDITFQDDLSSVLTGLTAIGLPLNDICGTGSSLAGLSTLIFQGGSLAAGTSCQVDVTLQVPGGAASNTYNNATSGFRGTIGGSSLSFPNAFDQLVVSSDRLAISKSFTDDPVFPGETATLEFTVTNLDASLAATGITFTDDLDGALAGLTAAGLPIDDVCGVGSQILGSGLVTLTGGNLAPGGSCTFSVVTQVPASVPIGSAVTNVTSDVSGTMNGLPVTGYAASDDLLINYFNFAKSFVTPAPAGGSTTLTFTIENVDASAGVAQISFTDDLDAVLTGMAAVGLPAAGVCGPGSEISGTSVLTLSGGALNPGETCTFGVEVAIPSSATPGSFDNITSTLFVAGNPSSEPATASLDVEAAAATTAIPTATPLGSLVLIMMLITASVWLLRIKD